MRSEIQPMPKSIVRAICTICATVDAVKKTGRNSHGGYMYSSTDDMYAATARKMGEVELTVLSLEDEHEIVRIERDGKTSQWLRVVYRFVLATPEDTWTDPNLKRSLFIQVTGPQTHQAAQSFAEKSFLRSLFKLPSGDMDLDSLPQADNEDDQIKLSAPAGKRKSSAAAKRDGDGEKFVEALAKIKAMDEATAIIQYRTKEWEWWSTLPAAWRTLIDDTYVDKMKDLGVRVDPDNLDMFLEAAE
jgi:hypothetical protein